MSTDLYWSEAFYGSLCLYILIECLPCTTCFNLSAIFSDHVDRRLGYNGFHFI